MVVFTSSLINDEDIKNAVLADVKMTHPNILVKETILTYTIAIHYILKNPTDPNRAENAF
jgi:hypothetical protein